MYVVAAGIAGAAVGAAVDPVGQRLADLSRAADDRRRAEREARRAEEAGAVGAGAPPEADVVSGDEQRSPTEPTGSGTPPAPPATVPSADGGPGTGHPPAHSHEHVVSDDTAGESEDGPTPVRHLLPSGHSTSRTGGAAVVTGVLWAVAAQHFGQHLLVTPFLVFLALAVAVSVTDLSHRLVPRTLLYGSLVLIAPLLVIVSAVDGTWHDLVIAVVGGAVAFVVFFVIWFAMPRGMGFGDVRLAGVIGLTVGYLGLVHVYLAFLSGFVIGLLFGLALMVGSSAGRKTRIPFAPALCIGAVIAILWGGTLAHDLFHASS